MKRLVEDVDGILAREVGKALPEDVEAGRVELEISGVGIQEVDIISTPGRYGGFLRWFVCPGCEQRVGKLYLPTGKYAFLCRHCYRLGYQAQYSRAHRKPEPREVKERRETLREQRKRLLDQFMRATPEEKRKIIENWAERSSRAISNRLK